MNRIKYLIFFMLTLCLSFSYVNAECTKEEIELLKKESNRIRVTYKHLGEVDNGEDGVSYDQFDLTFSNLKEDMYVRLDDYNWEWKSRDKNNEIKFTFSTGTYVFSIYSDKCHEKLSDIRVVIPRFNIYSLDPLCDGIDGNDFPLCGKYYKYDIEYNKFKSKVEEYRKNNIFNDESVDAVEKDDVFFKNILSKVLTIITKYKLYILFALSILFGVLLALIAVRKKRKRGVLE